MHEFFRRLAAHPWTATELLVASLFANLLALASPLFVIQVLNRYVSYGVDATLATLTSGVVIAIGLEAAFRRARLLLAANELGDRDEERAVGAFGVLATARRAALDDLPAGQRREVLRGLEAVETAYGPVNLATILDVPFALLFIAALALLSPILGGIAAAFIGVVFVFGLLAQRRLRRPNRDLAEAAAEGSTLASALERSADTLRAFNGTRLLMDAWRDHVGRSRSLRRRLGARQGTSQAVAQTAQALMGVAVIAVGATLVVDGRLDVGTLIGANLLAARALGPVNRFAQLSEPLARARQALSRVESLTRLPVEREQGAALGAFEGGLAFRDVAFAHPGMPGPLFESLSLSLAPGSVLIVTGGNGSGKTTLARLIVALLEPDRGQILADGIDLRQTVPAWWRRQVIYVPQEPDFLPGTIRDNLIAANPDVDEAGLERVVRAAALGRFIDESPDGLDTRLVDGGAGLAPGIRRRLALARGLAVDGMLAVFDEPTEGLDAEGRAAVYGAMKDLSSRGRTMVVFTHDPAILKGARQILDLDSKPVPRVLSAGAGAGAGAAREGGR